MFKSYLLIAVRNLLKYKSFSAIIILGMGLSLASFILISIFVYDEYQYDRHHPEGDSVFRLYSLTSSPEEGESYLAMVPPVLATRLSSQFPEISSTARILGNFGENQMEVGNKMFNETGVMHVEGNLLDILAVPILEGDRNQVLGIPHVVALSESMASKYFDAQNPIGQTIKIDGVDHEVTHVYQDFPEQSHVQFNAMVSLESISANWTPERTESWIWHQFYTYVKVHPGTDLVALEEKFQTYVKDEAGEIYAASSFHSTPKFQNLYDIHLGSSEFTYDIAKTGNKDTVYILVAAAIMILLISCFNFVNLSTARAVKRMKEVGVRKVIGAHNSQLKTQFLLESCTFAFLGLATALLFTWIALPYLSQLTGNTMVMPFNFETLLFLVGFCLILGIISGAYPAFLLSSYKPASVIAGAKDTQEGHALFRKSLVVFQFVLSFILIIGAWIVIDQNQLLIGKDLGFEKDSLLVVYANGVKESQLEGIKSEIISQTGVDYSTWGYGLPGDIFAADAVINPLTGERLSTKMFIVDYDYINTMGMELLAGRDFSSSFGTDQESAFIINQTAANNFGMGSPEEAIGQRLDWERWSGDSLKRGEVIGVVKDFHANSLKEKITPLVMHIEPGVFYTLTVKLNPNNIQEQVKSIEAIFNEQVPGRLFSYTFLDDNFEKMYQSEQKLSTLLNIFAGLTILVACMGLFGLVEYHVHQRAKEISIRKVFGARVDSIVVTLTKQYFLLILIAFILASPLVWYGAEQWLQNFAYHIDITPMIFLKAAILISIITLLTVSSQAIKAALGNPAQVLKGE